MKPKPRSATTFLTVPVVTLTPFTSRTDWQAHGLFEKQVDRREAPSLSTTTGKEYARSAIGGLAHRPAALGIQRRGSSPGWAPGVSCTRRDRTEGLTPLAGVPILRRSDD